MDGRVKIVNQLRTDVGLRQNQLNGGNRIARVTVEHRKEGLVAFGGIEKFLFHRQRAAAGKPRNCSDSAAQKFSNLCA